MGLLVSWRALAFPLSPDQVVKWAVKAAPEDKLGLFLAVVDVVSIQAQKDQPRSPQEIVQLLKSIDLKELKTDQPGGEHKQGARVRVCMTSPVQMRFVVFCTGLPDGEPRWKITEVYIVERGSNKERSAKPAMTSPFHAGQLWRGVADARRYAN
jgi:hypothetical protein